jgi:hypothetical protein
MSRSFLPEVDTKLNQNSVNLWKIKDKERRERRIKELNEWANGYSTTFKGRRNTTN